MTSPNRNAPEAFSRGASKNLSSGQTVSFEDSTTPDKFKQADKRLRQPVPLRIAAAPVIARLAQRYRISTLHAAVVTDLLEIGGRS